MTMPRPPAASVNVQALRVGLIAAFDAWAPSLESGHVTDLEFKISAFLPPERAVRSGGFSNPDHKPRRDR